MRLSVRVQHHPSRHDLIPRITAALAGFDDLAVIADPEPDGKPDAWRSHRACMKSLPDDATHLLVLQEDALPVPSFLPKMNAALEQHPESILLPFVPGFGYLKTQMWDAQRVGQSYTSFIVRAFVPTVAILYPREVVTSLLKWVDAYGRRPMRGADDAIVAHYCRKHRITPLALVPSICDHDASLLTIGKFHPRPGDHRRAALL